MVLTCYDFNHMKCMHALHGDAHPLPYPGLHNRGNAGNMFPATLKFWQPHLSNLLAGSKTKPAKWMEDSQMCV